MEKRVRAIGLVLCAAAIWGSSFVVIKLGLGDPGGGVAAAPPVTSSLLRFAVAALASTLILRVSGPIGIRPLRDPLVGAMALSNAVGYGMQYMGLVQTNPAVASLLANIAVVVTVLLSAAVLHERISARTAFAVTLAFAGGSVLATRGDLTTIGTPAFAGAVMIAVSSVFWSVYVVLNKMTLERRKYSESEVAWAIFVLTALATLPIAVALEGVPTLAYGPVAWGSILYNGIMCSSVAYIVYMIGLRELTAISTAVLSVAEILFAFLLTFLVFGEGLNPVTVLGAALVLGGILLTSLGSEKKAVADSAGTTAPAPGDP